MCAAPFLSSSRDSVVPVISQVTRPLRCGSWPMMATVRSSSSLASARCRSHSRKPSNGRSGRSASTISTRGTLNAGATISAVSRARTKGLDASTVSCGTSTRRPLAARRILAGPPETSRPTPHPNPLPFGRGEGELRAYVFGISNFVLTFVLNFAAAG